jgi:cation diffusion facilitator CzcD-associated flavoprotein CzcO
LKELDMIIVGAGLAGIEMLRQSRVLGLNARVFEAGSDVGGTWYWNRYPGCRTDCEAWSYCYTVYPEVLQEWDWPERYPSQETMHEYIRYVVEKYDYRRDIQFNTKISSPRYEEESTTWTVDDSNGETWRAPYLLLAVGLLSEPYTPQFKGIDSFTGEVYHPIAWPDHEVDFTGKRVGIIGTGSTGVQLIPEIAATGAETFVFQRTPNYVVPSQNFDFDDEYRRNTKAAYEDLLRRAEKSTFGMPIEMSGRLLADYSPEEQRKIFEGGWQSGGFRFLFETFDDLATNLEANFAACEFIRSKIRETVKDPETAELLCPTNHPYASKRPPVGNDYYEAYNLPNVHLVDVARNPIEEILPDGLRTTKEKFDLDVIIYATGYDGQTGAFTAINPKGRDGQTLRDYWKDGARTFMGMHVRGFPNMLMINGPLCPFTNTPPLIEMEAKWVGEVLAYARERGLAEIEVTAAAEKRWVDEVNSAAVGTVLLEGIEANSWLLGANIPGKAHQPLTYLPGLVAFREFLEAEVEAGYPALAR